MTTKITKSFSSQSGATTTITGELVTEKKVWLDGDEDTVPACEIIVSVYHSKAGYLGSYAREMTAKERKGMPADITHICGNAAMTAEKAEIINSVRRELEALPEWQAHLAKIAQAEAEADEYERTTGRLLREMDREDSDY